MVREFFNLFEKVMEWCLPKFDDGDSGKIGLFKWQAQRMSNYLKRLIHETNELDCPTKRSQRNNMSHNSLTLYKTGRS